jgi:hypothetical protein
MCMVWWSQNDDGKKKKREENVILSFFLSIYKYIYIYMRYRALVRIISEVWVKVMSALKELAAKLGDSYGTLYDPSCRSRCLVGCVATFEVVRVNPIYKIVLFNICV